MVVNETGASELNIFIFFLMTLTSVGYFLYEIFRRYRFTQLGKRENRYNRPAERWKYLFTNVVMQKKIREYPVFGMFHFFIMLGFLILLVGMPNMAIEGLFSTNIHYLGDNHVFLFVKDICNTLVIIGVLGAAARRMFRKPEWLKNGIADFVKLGLILTIVLTEVCFHSIRFALGQDQNLVAAAPLAFASSHFFVNINEITLFTAMSVFWWTHFLAVFSLCFIIPNSSHLHLVFAPFNSYWHTIAPKGALSRIEQDDKRNVVFGANYMEDFTWKQLFDTYSCVKCGRCNGQCPGQLSGEAIKPRAINGRMRKHIDARAPLLMQGKADRAVIKREIGTKSKIDKANKKEKHARKDKFKSNLAGGLFEQEFVWSCTTCGACLEACPVSIEHIPKLIDMRRYLVLTAGNIGEDMKQVFAGIAGQGNPWGYSYEEGIQWAEELSVPTIQENPQAEYLYYAGCAANFDATAKKTAAAFVKLLQVANVNFTVLGSSEWCCGDTARRMGNESLFEETVNANIATWNRLGIKKIITTCPHCFNTLKNEYPQYGGEFEVIHHADFLAALLRERKLVPTQSFAKRVVFHDPCYLGRYNDLFSSPREVINALPEARLTEMPRTQERSFCCGAGGGRIWTMPTANNLITANRVREAVATGTDVIGTACPFCKMVFSETVKLEGSNDNIQVLDIAEILASNIQLPGGMPMRPEVLLS
ncbi:putative iron-sulfur-binding oxidoreductase FadF [Sporomusa silvacetica DSM 10669]|uniref:Iron-sulfur-binding oxidoreductase FadF n=1 Tax=Sporomusa silvacetica DSM 10669 TaxID=1123289 RepID=A0ABZ3IQE1_9FIRM|nr:(Fe-S)-binding protein [Sporomusa silvacetica]OZC22869.1 anaerobic glycerol-3-phosphate dehydrogenase subunit C [Sporomusa silvacetica DSM 10669]